MSGHLRRREAIPDGIGLFPSSRSLLTVTQKATTVWSQRDYLELAAGVTSHIPDKVQVTVRYYGLCARAHRGKVKKVIHEAFNWKRLILNNLSYLNIEAKTYYYICGDSGTIYGGKMSEDKVSGNKIEILIAWARLMGEKGIFNKETASSRIRAIQNLASILDVHEKGDLTFLLENIDDINTRWATRTNATPSTIQPNKSHAKGLIEDYLKYQRDPSSLKPVRRRTKEKKAPLKIIPTAEIRAGEKDISNEKLRPNQYDKLPISINLQIHISAEAPESQIEKIFESIAKHIYKKP